jgi:hypothetical protein
MNIAEEIEQRRALGRCIVLPTPPACQVLVEQAKAAGIPIGRLFVLSRPLQTGVQGSFDEQTKDIWCHYSCEGGDGARRLLQCLLILIARIKLAFPLPNTVEEDWEHTRLAHQEAFTLAEQWGHTDIFSVDDLTRLLAADEYLYAAHLSAGALAGHLGPGIARTAYVALRKVKQRHGWDERAFHDALHGRSLDETANEAVLDFDRTLLRPLWLLTTSKKCNARQLLFGQCARPQTPATAQMLRTALEQAAEDQAAHVPLPTLSSMKTLSWMRRPWHLAFLWITCEQDMQRAIRIVNTWLVDDFLECFAGVRWWCYADVATDHEQAPYASSRLYRIRVAYATPTQMSEETDGNHLVETRELWILFSTHSEMETVEGAWQRYICSWLACQELRCEPLSNSFQELWPWLGGENKG